MWHRDDVARVIKYLHSWPISIQDAKKEDYLRMSSHTQLALDLESLKRLHSAMMKAFYRVAVLSGEFSVVLQDHITGASVQISLSSSHCQNLISKSDVFAQIRKCLLHPNLPAVISVRFPVSSNISLPTWWSNDTDLSLMRSVVKYGFLEWRKGKQDQVLSPKIIPVVDSGLPDEVMLERLRFVCGYIIQETSRCTVKLIPGAMETDDDVIPIPGPVDKVPACSTPFTTDISEGTSSIPPSKSVLPQQVISEGTSYFVRASHPPALENPK